MSAQRSEIVVSLSATCAACLVRWELAATTRREAARELLAGGWRYTVAQGWTCEECSAGRPEGAGTLRLSERTTERVLLAYGRLPWPGGFFFVLRPVVPGHQWRRDFMPALNRYVATATGEPATKTTNGQWEARIQGIEGCEPEEEAGFVARALAGETHHHWAFYDPATREVYPVTPEEEVQS